MAKLAFRLQSRDHYFFTLFDVPDSVRSGQEAFEILASERGGVGVVLAHELAPRLPNFVSKDRTVRSKMFPRASIVLGFLWGQARASGKLAGNKRQRCNDTGYPGSLHLVQVLHILHSVHLLQKPDTC